MNSQAPSPPLTDRPRPPTLSSAERQALRRRAHPLQPVVLIGDAGLTEAVLRETDRALTHHELIKLRVASDDRGLRSEIAETLARDLGCDRIQSIGKVLVLWRPRPESGPGERGEPSRSPARQTVSRALAPVTKKQAGSGKKPELRPRKRDAAQAATDPPKRTGKPNRNAQTVGAGRARSVGGKPGSGFGGKPARSVAASAARRAGGAQSAPGFGSKPVGGSGAKPAGGPRAAPARVSGATRSARPAPRTRAVRRGP